MKGIYIISILLLFFNWGFSSRLISQGELDVLFLKYFQGDLTGDERENFHDVISLAKRSKLQPDDKEFTMYSSRNLEDRLECLICKSAFKTAIDFVHRNASNEDLTETLTAICVALNIEDYEVCHGAVKLNVPILTYVIKNTPEASASTFCGLLNQKAVNTGACPITDPRFEWTVDLPEFDSNEVTQPRDAQEDLTIVLITDAHIDPLYEAGGVAECNEPTCCRYGQKPKPRYFVHTNAESLRTKAIVEENGETLIDLGVANEVFTERRWRALGHAEPAGYWGDYRNCDTPLWAYDNVIDEIADKHQKIDAIYYVGDSIDHGVWETNYQLIKNMNEHIVLKIKEKFPGVPVFLTIGNHESQPTNQFAPPRVVGDGINTTWLYESLAEKWSDYLDADASTTIRQRGDYSMLVRPGLRVISLNNNVGYKYNWWLVYDPQEQKVHLDWLVDELHKAESKGEKVHILTHIPPGVSDLTYTWTREYKRIVNRFTKTITAEFNGHTHSDEFKIFYNNQGEPINMAWGGGSATSYTNYNLNYKIIDVEPINFKINEIRNYVYNLTEANLTPNRAPHWFMLYEMKQRFGLDDLSPQSINLLLNRMVTTEKSMLDLYIAFFSKMNDRRWFLCDERCKLDNLCKIVVTELWQRSKCNELVKLYHQHNSNKLSRE